VRGRGDLLAAVMQGLKPGKLSDVPSRLRLLPSVTPALAD
jgi:hypothetical protein